MSRRSNTITVGNVKKLIQKREKLIHSKISAGATINAIPEVKIRFYRKKRQLSTTTALNALSITDRVKRKAIYKITEAMGNEYYKVMFYGKKPGMDDINKMSEYREKLISLLDGENNYAKFKDLCAGYMKNINALWSKLQVK